MTTEDLETLRNAAMAQPEKERAQLANDLITSLDGPAQQEIAEAWDIEICRRINEIESGRAELLDLEEVLSRARSRLES